MRTRHQLICLVGLLLAMFEGSRVTAQKPKPSQIAAPLLMTTLQQLMAAYNKGSFVVASRYVSDGVISKCGGAQNFAMAMERNSKVERLTYKIGRVEVTGGSSNTLEADVYYSSQDASTGRAVDVNQGNGLTFTRSRRSDIPWVLADAFPLGVTAFCR